MSPSSSIHIVYMLFLKGYLFQIIWLFIPINEAAKFQRLVVMVLYQCVEATLKEYAFYDLRESEKKNLFQTGRK